MVNLELDVALCFNNDRFFLSVRESSRRQKRSTVFSY
jgi:hypothetical protein